jgi:hypothetical protein
MCVLSEWNEAILSGYVVTVGFRAMKMQMLWLGNKQFTPQSCINNFNLNMCLEGYRLRSGWDKNTPMGYHTGYEAVEAFH